MRDLRTQYTITRIILLLIGLLCLGLLFVNPVRNSLQAFPGRWCYILLLSCLTSLCLTPISQFLAVLVGAVDWPDRRKHHERPTPRLGGIAIFAGIVISLLMNGIWDPQIALLIICSLVLFGMGTIEDSIGIPNHVRLTVQVILAIILLHGGIMISLIPQSHFLGKTINGIVTVLWLVGLTNAFNFFDGLDGLASGLAILISTILGTIAFYTGQVHLGWVSVAILGGALGFLPYNFKPTAPAEVFLGDSGSTVLGFILAGLAVHGEWAIGHPLLNLATPLLIFGVLIFDMVHITISRCLKGDIRTFWHWLVMPGRDHLHHRFEALLRSKRFAVFMVLLLNFAFGLAGLVIRRVSLTMAMVLILHSLVLLIIITLLEKAGNLHERRRNIPFSPPKSKPPQPQVGGSP